jgi:hypothetical protein
MPAYWLSLDLANFLSRPASNLESPPVVVCTTTPSYNYTIYFYLFYFYLFFGEAGVWTHSLKSRWLTIWATTAVYFAVVILEMGSMHDLPRLALNYDPTNLSLPISWTCKGEPLMPSVSLFLYCMFLSLTLFLSSFPLFPFLFISTNFSLFVLHLLNLSQPC